MNELNESDYVSLDNNNTKSANNNNSIDDATSCAETACIDNSDSIVDNVNSKNSQTSECDKSMATTIAQTASESNVCEAANVDDEVFDFDSSDLDEHEDDVDGDERIKRSKSQNRINAESTPHKLPAVATEAEENESPNEVEHYVDNTLKVVKLAKTIPLEIRTEDESNDANEADFHDAEDEADDEIFNFLGKANGIVIEISFSFRFYFRFRFVQIRWRFWSNHFR